MNDDKKHRRQRERFDESPIAVVRATNQIWDNAELHRCQLLIDNYSNYYKRHPTKAFDATVFRLNPLYLSTQCVDKKTANEWAIRSFQDFDTLMRKGHFKFRMNTRTASRFASGKFGGRRTFFYKGYFFKAKRNGELVGGREAKIELYSKAIDRVKIPGNKQYLVVLTPRYADKHCDVRLDL